MKRDVRLEAIGGQGANSAGKILAEAVVIELGWAGNHFSSFGSEKRGSPVRSSVRYRDDGRPVRSASPILKPDVLAIFHESLLDHSVTATEGSHPALGVLVNSALAPRDLLFPAGFKAAQVATVNASAIALERGSGINAVLLGALLKLTPEIGFDVLKTAFARFFSDLKAEVLARNLVAMQEGYRNVRILPYDISQSGAELVRSRLPSLGYENAPLGGVIANPGNSILRDLSHARKGSIPILNHELCIHCGYCDMVCPDFCFSWQKTVLEESTITLPDGDRVRPEQQVGVPHLQGIDYRYCKACQKCIEACPVGALRSGLDTTKNRARSQVDRFQVATTEVGYPVYTDTEVTHES